MLQEFEYNFLLHEIGDNIPQDHADQQFNRVTLSVTSLPITNRKWYIPPYRLVRE